MHRSTRSLIVVPMAALALAACGQQESAAPAANAGPPPTPTLEQLREAATQATATLWEPSVRFGDVDGAAGSEAVAVLSSPAEGGGESVQVAVYGVRDGALATLGSAAVGAGVQLQGLWLEQGKIRMDVIEPGPEDAAGAPTQVARKTYAMEGGVLKQLTSEVRGVLGLSMLAANEWLLVEIDGAPLPAGSEAPLVLFEGETVRGFAGCNRFTAPVKETKPGEIDVGPGAATKMACPQPEMDLEQKFLTQLDAVNRYGYRAGQLALDWQAGETSGTLLFRK
ncbi:MAG: META domain-containing protein [Steroidobacteraceae bacterium]